MSLLAITSNHHAYRSHNSITFHHSRAIERLTPTPAHNNVHGNCGTRVTVRNLFGNMPVRVKQRAIITNHVSEQLRLRDALRRDVVGLLLSWQRPISLKIRDCDNETIVKFNTLNVAVPGGSQGAVVDNSRSTHLSSLLHIMTQAKYNTIEDWSSWVPASASTAALSIKGAISLEPSPTKQVQFISFGIRPLSSENGCNELYDEVNRLFALSSFGSVKDDADIDEKEQLRRQSDKRFKNKEYTNRQLKARKGVDRYAMFHLRISLKNKHASDMTDERFIDDESNLQAIVGVLSAMVTQWLSVHHFHTRKLYSLTDRPKSASVLSRESEQTRTPSRKRPASSSTPVVSTTSASRKGFTEVDTAKKMRRALTPLENPSSRPRPQAFADWSRIKSGKSSFFDTAHLLQKVSEAARSNLPDALEKNAGCQQHNGSEPHKDTALITPSICKDNLQPVSSVSSVPDGSDGTILWTDSVTKRTHLINARTGSIMPPQRSQINTSSALSPATARPSAMTALRLASKSASSEPAKTSWLHGLLQKWDNPVFKPNEPGIQQMSLQCDQKDGGENHPHHSLTPCCSFDTHKMFSDAGLCSTRLSKQALCNAEVISQVDKKFILVIMAGISADGNTRSAADTMVLIDQHAADERIQVEVLLDSLCASPQSSTCSDYKSNLGFASSVEITIFDKPLQFAISPHEYIHFQTFAANFAAWGILYGVSTSTAVGGVDDSPRCKLSVTALPPAISERCRANTEVLISFLRSALWKYVETPPMPPNEPSDQPTSWVRKIAMCPFGLVDMINSRACRSAVMFNDHLGLEDSKGLVAKLGHCMFPFMCAHGRPSMVPIVDMGMIGDSNNDYKGVGALGKETFVDAWKKWRQ